MQDLINRMTSTASKLRKIAATVRPGFAEVFTDRAEQLESWCRMLPYYQPEEVQRYYYETALQEFEGLCS